MTPKPRRGGNRPGPYDRAGRGGGLGGYGPPRGMGRFKGYGGEIPFWTDKIIHWAIYFTNCLHECMSYHNLGI